MINSQSGRLRKWYLQTCRIVIAIALSAPIVLASGSTADRVLGQFDFTHRAANLVDAKGFFSPDAVAIDASALPTRVYVADAENNRVLGWKDAANFSNGAPADLVIGQPDFISSECGDASALSLCTPTGVAVDGSGNLYVADLGNGRVLEYTNPFLACSNTFPCVGGPAHLVFGQDGSFTSAGCDSDTGGSDSTAIDLCDPTGVAVDKSGNLFVADSSNDRVLQYDTPLSTDTIADTVFGQGGDFTSSGCNSDTAGGNPTAKDLCDPTGVAVDGSGNLYVVDSVNERVLEYNAPFSTASSANKVFGQGGSFTSDACNGDTGGTTSTASDLCDPAGLAVDESGNLYVADASNSRVLEYNTPLTTDTVADAVFGQGGDFTSNICNFDIELPGSDVSGSTADDLCVPVGVAPDKSGNLFVADATNSRVLEYKTPLSTDTTADLVLGQLDFTHQFENLTDAQGLFGPRAVAIDTSVSPNRVYVADYSNSRVLGWNDAASFTNGAPADLVIGQPDFISYFCNGASGTAVSASSLCFPEGVAVDGLGNLYVADSSNSRVLEYSAPLSIGASASQVFGQGGSFTSNACNFDIPPIVTTPTTIDLCFPSGVALDGSGNLYVADEENQRVVEYNTPLNASSGESGAGDSTADLVFGQGGGCNNGGLGASSLCLPVGVALDVSGNLYVADFGNSRVLQYNTPLNATSGETGAGDTAADAVFGQGGSFTARKCNNGGIGANSLCLPTGVAVDQSGNLYIADGSNDRVLEYSGPPGATDKTADKVFGTCGSFTSSACTEVSSNSLKDPIGVALDSSGSLYVADNQNNRVMAYDHPLTVSPPTPTATATPTSTATPTATATATPTPTATATATGPGQISVSGKLLSLKAAPNASASGSITISNIGTGPLTANVTAPRHSPPMTELGGGSGIVIGPGGLHNVTIVFSPTKKGSIRDQILITSNDPKQKKPKKVKIKGLSN